MRYVKWTFWFLVITVVGGFFQYTLSQHDIVRVVDTEVRRVDFGENSIFWASPDTGTKTNLLNRDVRFINTVYPNGKIMVFRNEDTGWGWPPYFKLDSSNLQTEATDLASTIEIPKWVSITHYGWRNEFLTIYPNAVGIKAVDGPETSIFPWVNVVILSLFAILLFWIWRIWRRFKERRIDPVLEEAAVKLDELDDRADAARDQAKGIFGRFTAWLATWRGKPRV